MGNFLKVMRTLDCVSGLHNFLKFFQPPLVFRWQYVNTVKKVLFCLSSNRLSTKLSRHICSVRRKTIYYITIPLRHRELFHSQIILALGNFCGSTYQQVFWLYSHQQPFLWSVELYENPFPERSSHRHALKLVVCGNYSRILHRGCMTNSAICPHSIGRE